MLPTKRISLLPAATEIVCTLGFEQQLVGVSHACDYPLTVKNLPLCTQTTINSTADSLDIHQQVLAQAKQGALFTLNAQLINQLQPTLIITQSKCEVCAVDFDEVERLVQQMPEPKPQVLALNPQGFEGVYADIRNIANALGAQTQAEALIESLEERVALIVHKLKFTQNKPNVLCLEWLNPMLPAGNWVPQMVSMAGGQALAAGAHSLNWDELVQANPDVLVLMPCGFGIEQGLKNMGHFTLNPQFAQLQAVKNNRVYIADGNQYFNRPGPRLVESLEILAEIINPKQFVFGFEGNGWIKFSV